jgi:hypothetical protein
VPASVRPQSPVFAGGSSRADGRGVTGPDTTSERTPKSTVSLRKAQGGYSAGIGYPPNDWARYSGHQGQDYAQHQAEDRHAEQSTINGFFGNAKVHAPVVEPQQPRRCGHARQQRERHVWKLDNRDGMRVQLFVRCAVIIVSSRTLFRGKGLDEKRGERCER